MNKLARQALELCWEIEKFPASEHQTATVLKASALHQALSQLSTTIAPVAWYDLPMANIELADAIIQEWQKRVESGSPAMPWGTSELVELISNLRPTHSQPLGGAEAAAREIMATYINGGLQDEGWTTERYTEAFAAIIRKHQVASLAPGMEANEYLQKHEPNCHLRKFLEYIKGKGFVEYTQDDLHCTCSRHLPPTGWVKCSERMPEDFSNVIVFQPGFNPPSSGICESYYNPDQEYPFVNADEEVTHWMPLPEPPK